MRKPVFFSFENKIIGLELYAKAGNLEASQKLCQILGFELHPMKLAVENLYRTHFLIDEGILEKNASSLVTLTYRSFRQQPVIINPQYMKTCSPALSLRIGEGLKHFNKKYAAEKRNPYI